MTKPKTHKYIIYRAHWSEDKGWRTFSGSRSLTGILQEHFDSSGRPIPEVGERLTEGKKDEDGTHYSRWGDWVVDRVESYLPDLPVGQEFTEVVICWCKYSPVEPVWVPQGKSIVSVESFGGDVEAFEEWKATATDKDRYRVVEIPEGVKR
ncbi:MAG TPA: hypothetical protein IGS17_15885 [Oscillatoriales cyanobacterium M59_W2019_021]|nr:hypothetical protein [Oscillatoriales cyanobacterium M4454_W2019_049]HIK52387.1 hypothetical protein [Oscillatoriales cyanobacterium M59_W2019_021]